MFVTQDLVQEIKLTKEQKEEGYWVEQDGNLVTVWYNRKQVALLLFSPNINEKIQAIVERNKREFEEAQERI